MRIQRKIIAILLISMLLSFSLLFLVIRHLTLKAHLKIEKDLAHQNIIRMEGAFEDLILQLGIKSSDWGNWDDTYQYIQDHNSDYVESNLGDSSLKNIKINFMIFADQDGKIVKSKHVSETEWKEIPATPDLDQLMQPIYGLRQNYEKPFEKGGFIVINQKPAVVFSRPILKSDGTGPPRGTLIWGYYLTEKIINEISIKTHLKIEFNILKSETSHPHDTHKQTSFILVSDELAEGYTILDDINGKRIFYVEIFFDRPIYQQAIKNITYLGFVLLMAMIIFTSLIYQLLDRVIISRMLEIHEDLEKISNADCKTMRVREMGNDEIGTLSYEINRTLDALEKSHSKLEATRQQLIQSQRLESLGQLAGGIAHDFNNILTSIMGYATMLQGKFSQDASVSKKLMVIVNSTERGALLVKQLLGFARRGKYQVTAFSTNELITEFLDLLKSTAKKVTVETSLAPDDCIIEGDSTQILQVLLNLGFNAKDAMPDGGKLYFGTQKVPLDEPALKSLGAPDGTEPGWYVHITVRDTGHGIPKNIQDKVFDPFFTTKGPGKGSGLGLATARGIIENHHGWITLHSEEGCGTTFHLFLPASAKLEVEKVKNTNNTPIDLSIIENKTILVTDDEKGLRDYIYDVLSPHKVNVITAENGKESAEKFHEQLSSKPIDLVILDIIMPDYDGFYAYDKIHREKPETPILFASGYGEDGKVSAIRQEAQGNVFFIQKPYKPDNLLATIANAFRKEKSYETGSVQN